MVDNESTFGGSTVLISGGPTGGRVDTTFRFTTIADNVTAIDSLGAGLNVMADSGPKAVHLVDSVLTGTLSGPSVGTDDCRGNIVTAGVNFISSNSCTTTSGPAPLTVDPQLQPITDVAVPYGGTLFSIGPVPVAAPAATSPVIDAADCGPLNVDVVGALRPTGPACDAGAVEASGLSLTLVASSAAPTASGSAVPLAQLPPSAVQGKTLAAGVAPTVDNQAVRSIDLKNSPLGRSRSATRRSGASR